MRHICRNAPHLSQSATLGTVRHFGPNNEKNKINTDVNLNLRIRSAPKSAASGLSEG